MSPAGLKPGTLLFVDDPAQSHFSFTFFFLFLFLNHLGTGTPQYSYFSKETRTVLFPNQQVLIKNLDLKILNNEV